MDECEVLPELPKSWVWSSPEGVLQVEPARRIFCNRSVNMESIFAVGFDMDYTLAQYKPETFGSLAFKTTAKKLVEYLGYPVDLLAWSFDWNHLIRGLVIDKKRGNILKMDRHKYVKVAYHGLRVMSTESKNDTYQNTSTRGSFDGPNYALLDTLSSLVEGNLYAQLVEFIDHIPGSSPTEEDYAQMYKHVREAVDLCHRDGSLKQTVAKDPRMYINEDESLVPLLKMLRDSGRSLFLLTNSLWDYTNVVMNFLCENRTMDSAGGCNFDWLEYFDVVITGSAKPGFFYEKYHADLFKVHPESGMLLNTNNGTPIAQVGDTTPRLSSNGKIIKTKIFQGGNAGHLHKLLPIESNSEVLYVGDHILNILRSKIALGWRTMLVVPELKREVELLCKLQDLRKELRWWRNERDLLEDKIHHLEWFVRLGVLNDNEKQRFSSEHEELEAQRDLVHVAHQEDQYEFHLKFHHIWGQLMKTGYQRSRFALQIDSFACLYTSQASNLSLYPPYKYYRPIEEVMPREFDVVPGLSFSS